MEIKFRAKEISTKKWCKGHYILHQIILICSSIKEEMEETCEHYLVIPETLGQFTNINDSKGNEIYAGDIICDEQNRHWIVYTAPGGFCICRTDEWSSTNGNPIMASGLSEPQNVAFTEQSCIVIGNIFDNPELLGG